MARGSYTICETSPIKANRAKEIHDGSSSHSLYSTIFVAITTISILAVIITVITHVLRTTADQVQEDIKQKHAAYYSLNGQISNEKMGGRNSIDTNGVESGNNKFSHSLPSGNSSIKNDSNSSMPGTTSKSHSETIDNRTSREEIDEQKVKETKGAAKLPDNDILGTTLSYLHSLEDSSTSVKASNIIHINKRLPEVKNDNKTLRMKPKNNHATTISSNDQTEFDTRIVYNSNIDSNNNSKNDLASTIGKSSIPKYHRTTLPEGTTTLSPDAKNNLDIGKTPIERTDIETNAGENSSPLDVNNSSKIPDHFLTTGNSLHDNHISTTLPEDESTSPLDLNDYHRITNAPKARTYIEANSSKIDDNKSSQITDRYHAHGYSSKDSHFSRTLPELATTTVSDPNENDQLTNSPTATTDSETSTEVNRSKIDGNNSRQTTDHSLAPENSSHDTHASTTLPEATTTLPVDSTIKHEIINAHTETTDIEASREVNMSLIDMNDRTKLTDHSHTSENSSQLNNVSTILNEATTTLPKDPEMKHKFTNAPTEKTDIEISKGVMSLQIDVNSSSQLTNRSFTAENSSQHTYVSTTLPEGTSDLPLNPEYNNGITNAPTTYANIEVSREINTSLNAVNYSSQLPDHSLTSENSSQPHFSASLPKATTTLPVDPENSHEITDATITTTYIESSREVNKSQINVNGISKKTNDSLTSKNSSQLTDISTTIPEATTTLPLDPGNNIENSNGLTVRTDIETTSGVNSSQIDVNGGSQLTNHSFTAENISQRNYVNTTLPEATTILPLDPGINHGFTNAPTAATNIETASRVNSSQVDVNGSSQLTNHSFTAENSSQLTDVSTTLPEATTILPLDPGINHGFTNTPTTTTNIETASRVNTSQVDGNGSIQLTNHSFTAENSSQLSDVSTTLPEATTILPLDPGINHGFTNAPTATTNIETTSRVNSSQVDVNGNGQLTNHSFTAENSSQLTDVSTTLPEATTILPLDPGINHGFTNAPTATTNIETTSRVNSSQVDVSGSIQLTNHSFTAENSSQLTHVSRTIPEAITILPLDIEKNNEIINNSTANNDTETSREVNKSQIDFNGSRQFSDHSLTSENSSQLSYAGKKLPEASAILPLDSENNHEITNAPTVTTDIESSSNVNSSHMDINSSSQLSDHILAAENSSLLTDVSTTVPEADSEGMLPHLYYTHMAPDEASDDDYEYI